MGFLKRKKSNFTITPEERKERKQVGDIIAVRIGMLAHENGEGVDYAAEEISKECNIKCELVDSVMRGLDYYVVEYAYGESYVRIDAFTMVCIIKAAAMYFNTSIDYILGITDKAY